MSLDAPHPVLIAERSRDLAILGPRPPWWRPLRRARHLRLVAVVMVRDVSVLAYQQRQFLRELYPASTVTRMATPHDKFDAVWSKPKREP